MKLLQKCLFSALLISSVFLIFVPKPLRAQTAEKEGIPQIAAYLKADAERMRGMCNIYVQDGRYLMEVPDSIIGRDILAAITIVQGSTQKERSTDKRFGYSGDAVFERVFCFQKVPGKRLQIVQPLFMNSRDTATEFYRSATSVMLPVSFSFDIKAESGHSTLIDITEQLTGDADLFSLKGAKDDLGLGELQSDKSSVVRITCFPGNINFRTVKSYGPGKATSAQNAASPPVPEQETPAAGKEETLPTIWEVGASWILLPEHPMPQRFADNRIGYFTRMIRDLDHYPSNPKTVRLATRWDLRPKQEDMKRYLSGELVEPANPILFYIDRNTPAYLVPYFIEGVNEWRKAFEKAGFKNAISAKLEPSPEEDSTYSLEDVRYSYISYKASPVPNAYGPAVCDPRSGQIISSRVAVFHNVMDLIQRWHFAMCSAVDSSARQFPVTREVMGRLVRNVITHEVGHTLGLMHNFAGSTAYDVDSIRNTAFVRRNGFGASIMDYMRFNYVVQPEDSMPIDLLLPRIGVYDLFAIEWGYRCLPQFNSPKDEAAFLEKWVSEKRRDRRLRFGKETDFYDPRFQSEDVGNDAVKAGRLGIKNLRITMQHFDQWMKASNADLVYYKQQYRSILGRYHNYISHVQRSIGGRYNNDDALPGEDLQAYQPLTRKQQQDAMDFLKEYLFTYPAWLFPPKVIEKAAFDFERDGAAPFGTAVSKLFLANSQVSNNEWVAGDSTYPQKALLDDIYHLVFGRMAKGQPVNAFDRLLQRTFVAKAISATEGVSGFNRDLATQLMIMLDDIEEKSADARLYEKDILTNAHLQSLSDMISIWKNGTAKGIADHQ